MPTWLTDYRANLDGQTTLQNHDSDLPYPVLSYPIRRTDPPTDCPTISSITVHAAKKTTTPGLGWTGLARTRRSITRRHARPSPGDLLQDAPHQASHDVLRHPQRGGSAHLPQVLPREGPVSAQQQHAAAEHAARSTQHERRREKRKKKRKWDAASRTTKPTTSSPQKSSHKIFFREALLFFWRLLQEPDGKGQGRGAPGEGRRWRGGGGGGDYHKMCLAPSFSACHSSTRGAGRLYIPFLYSFSGDILVLSFMARRSGGYGV